MVPIVPFWAHSHIQVGSMGEFLSVRESARLLTYTAQDVCVNIDGCKALAKRIVEFVVEGKDDVFGTNTWCLSPQHPNKVG